MKKTWLLVMIVFALLLTGCSDSAEVYNFEPRKDNTYIDIEKKIIIDYKTDSDGKLVEIDIDRLLTVEEMIYLNPVVDPSLTIDGYDGEIFTNVKNSCTNYNDILVPVNIEVGNTRYKYNETVCEYQTVDNYNEFRAGFADNYGLEDTIPVNDNVIISIIIYNPTEIVRFVEILELQNTVESLGVASIQLNSDRNDYLSHLTHYYFDMSILEQLYLKHQTSENAIDEINGFSTEINLLDLDSLSDIEPLIEDFNDVYELEVNALEELELEIGIGFDEDE
jgi:hypothetical protein